MLEKLAKHTSRRWLWPKKGVDHVRIARKLGGW